MKRTELCRTLPLRLLGVLRTMQLHGPNNGAVTAAIARLQEALAALSRGGTAEVAVQLIDHILMVDEVRVSMDVREDPHLEPLLDLFSARGLGGLRFFRALEDAELHTFLEVLARPARDEAAAEALRAELTRLAHLGVDTIARRTIASAERQRPVDVTAMSFALQTYARAVVAFRELVAGLRCGRDPLQGRISVVRVVRDLIEIVRARPSHLLRVLQARDERGSALADGYAELHAADTAIYALLIGRVLGFDRIALLDLGTSALLADVGLAVLPEELTQRPETFSPEQRAELERFMRRATQTIIGRGPADEAMMTRVIVAYEHHEPYARGPMRARTHIFSRIVAVADAFDAMTSARPWRAPKSESEALEALGRDAGARFDPCVVSALAALITARHAA